MALQDLTMLPLSRLGCPLSRKTPNMGNTSLHHLTGRDRHVVNPPGGGQEVSSDEDVQAPRYPRSKANQGVVGVSAGLRPL